MEHVITVGKPFRKLIDAETSSWPRICVTPFGMS